MKEKGVWDLLQLRGYVLDAWWDSMNHGSTRSHARIMAWSDANGKVGTRVATLLTRRYWWPMQRGPCITQNQLFVHIVRVTPNLQVFS
jgi:hypothetical protein